MHFFIGVRVPAHQMEKEKAPVFTLWAVELFSLRRHSRDIPACGHQVCSPYGRRRETPSLSPSASPLCACQLSESRSPCRLSGDGAVRRL